MRSYRPLAKDRSVDVVRGDDSKNQDRNRGRFGVRREVKNAEFEFSESYVYLSYLNKP